MACPPEKPPKAGWKGGRKTVATGGSPWYACATNIRVRRMADGTKKTGEIATPNIRITRDGRRMGVHLLTPDGSWIGRGGVRPPARTQIEWLIGFRLPGGLCALVVPA